MGASWRDHPAWRVVDQAETALGESLAPLILDAPAEQLARTRDAQLAVLLTSLVAWEAIRDRIEAPVAFAGHSLGQVTALIAAGVLPLEDGVRFAARRAELTQAAADAHPGRMVALLGASLEQAADACRAAPDACWIANDNAPGQVVIAGTPDGVEVGSAKARVLGVKRATPLNVGGAFHTPLMRDAADGLGKLLERSPSQAPAPAVPVGKAAGAAELPHVPLAKPTSPVVSNDDAQPYDDSDGWRPRLAVHVTKPVQWRTSMETLAGLGTSRFLEVGHGSMLATLAKRIVPDLPVQGVATPDNPPTLTEVP
jgi:[acyl-carrier-protein] S-malonyltransferase